MSVFSNLGILIEPADLASRLDAEDLILVDLSSATRYAEGHIPGAHYVDSKLTQRAGTSTPGLVPDIEALNNLFSALGHRPEATYVVYDDEGGGWAGRFIWLLDVIGHRHYHFLNGGLQAWISEQRPLSREVPVTTPRTVSLTLSDSPTATAQYLQSRLGAPDLAVWDARSPAEYRGEKVLAARAGHVPGAVNFEWTAGMDSSRGLRIRQDMLEQLQALGITPDKEIITHCQTHRRSGFTYVVAKALGFPRVKAYAGSWSEWGNLPDTPIEVSEQ